jgi:hypothetical protein
MGAPMGGPAFSIPTRPADPTKAYDVPLVEQKLNIGQQSLTNAQLQGQQLRNTDALHPFEIRKAAAAAVKAEMEAREAKQKAESFGKERAVATAEIRNVIEAAKKAQKLSKDGWFATGFGADIAKNMGGTPAKDVEGLVNTIGANTAFDRLQRMRDASQTGGALGAISERELDLLRDSIAAIGQGQSDSQFQENMGKVINSYENVLFRLPEGRADFNRRVYEMIKDGADLPQVKALYEASGFKFPPESARRIQSAIAKTRARQKPTGVPPGWSIEEVR